MSVQAALALCHVNHAFLYEVRPDLFPQGFLTDVELELWGKYFESKKQ